MVIWTRLCTPCISRNTLETTRGYLKYRKHRCFPLYHEETFHCRNSKYDLPFNEIHLCGTFPGSFGENNNKNDSGYIATVNLQDSIHNLPLEHGSRNIRDSSKFLWFEVLTKTKDWVLSVNCCRAVIRKPLGKTGRNCGKQHSHANMSMFYTFLACSGFGCDTPVTWGLFFRREKTCLEDFWEYFLIRESAFTSSRNFRRRWKTVRKATPFLVHQWLFLDFDSMFAHRVNGHSWYLNKFEKGLLQYAASSW